MSSLHALVGLAAALTNADTDGRVVVDAAAQTVKFVLLNAAAHFGKVGAYAHAVSALSKAGNLCYMRNSLTLRNAPTLERVPDRPISYQVPACGVQVVAAAHAVVLASGTLAPVEGLRRALFPALDPAAVHRFSCGHVVPPERLLALALGRGPTGRELDLRAERRGAPDALDELGRLLLNVCQAIPEV